MDDRMVDRIFAGSLEHRLPPVSSKIVRIFTSSTFTDTGMERNTLMAQVYPKLKDYCREKHGLEFQVVDMRWGVRDEATDDHMTTELCMREIRNCQRLSMGPNFVCFLGQKYGYRPIPTYIVSAELQLLRDELTALNVDGSTLDLWYRKDSNAVPPVSVLQPISSILVNFNNKRVPKLQQQDQAIWWDTMVKMQKLLRKASQSLFNGGKIDKDTMHNYFMSVTEREIINGILNVKNTKNHCLGYIRYINNINLQNLKKASLFIDILNRSLDTEACKLMADLRDVRLPNKIEATNLQRYTIEWIGREGLDPDTHSEYLQHFITHFYKNMVKLVDRAMRKEDSSAQGQIVTEILQHMNACMSCVEVFYGREDTLERIRAHQQNPEAKKPLVLYGEGGCGKTSMLSKSASMSPKWFPGSKPICIIRFLGTTPDSSSLQPTLVSICQQISYNYMLPFEDIPDDLVPLTAYFKYLLTMATKEMPLLLFLDSIDQLTGAQGANKISWLPTKIPPHCKIILTCAAEADNPEISRDYHLLRRMIDADENFIEITDLGEDLAMQVTRMWMQKACRDLTNYQWRLVANAISKCSLPIFVKLVFAEICRWRSYTRPQETYLASTIMDSIMMLFERIEKQHGRLLVFHALAYITAAKSGLSESELEDLISLDDKVLDDVYQYHLPPTRRIPPLLWTRIRNDLPNYLSEREADGVSVMNWYHRQFRDAAKERYFKNKNLSNYFHSSIADYFLGIWGGGVPKPFKFTEIQRHRFNLASKDSSADRKVPTQPLVYYTKEGKVSRYNLRKFGELPFHLVRSQRFDDLFEHVLFNYQWIHAKLSSCPLQAVLSDFEDACAHLSNKETIRELTLVADALRLGGAILGVYPDMLASQLVGRLLPEIATNPNVKRLLEQCDKEGPHHSALIPMHHCLHTPGGPLKYSLEGHQFAVFGFKLTADYRYIVSVSNKFLTWDLATSDLTREVNPDIEGIMQNLVLSPDNRFAAAYTNNNMVVLLNMLSSEFVILATPLENDEEIHGVFLLNAHLLVHGSHTWVQYSLQGDLQARHEGAEFISATFAQAGMEDESGWVRKPILTMECQSLQTMRFILWSGQLDKPDMMLIASNEDGQKMQPLPFHSAMAQNAGWTKVYCMTQEKGVVEASVDGTMWTVTKEFDKPGEQLLQLKLDKEEEHLFGTTCNGFRIWHLEKCTMKSFTLPHSVRNISTKMLQSNSCVLSLSKDILVAAVRKSLHVWNVETEQLLKQLDAHFGRIISLEPLTIGNWNLIITSSIDRSVKVWNINNIFEQVHAIDRHELQIDQITIAQEACIAVTVTRGCVGVWDLLTGTQQSRLADSPLGAIVTHAEVTSDGRYIVSAESGNLIIWNRAQESVIFKEEQPNIKQILLLNNGERFLTVSGPPEGSTDGLLVVRTLPDGGRVWAANFSLSTSFKPAVVTSDNEHIVICSQEDVSGVPKSSKKPSSRRGSVSSTSGSVHSSRSSKSSRSGSARSRSNSVGSTSSSTGPSTKEMLMVFDAETGTLNAKFQLKSGKEVLQILAMPNKGNLVAVIDSDKATVVDIRGGNGNNAKVSRTIQKWGGCCTQDGKYGLYAPTRGGLQLLELKHGATVKTFIPKVAEGVFTVMSLFNQTDEYVLYYHSGRRTLRVFRTADASMIANYRVQAELSAIASTKDGKALVLGAVDGCISVLALADPSKPEMISFLSTLPSRDEKWKKESSLKHREIEDTEKLGA
ncbi:Hypothetical predicted protein [Cloeon dipterum]|uniref:DUF4062 domain-containing protein n=3 Tax=Cloeon dipterum TaxID=197152 RepID=A0A8S1CJL0_9INSE|nr:Hypothetical predicted protein [Cloeon dipterum]